MKDQKESQKERLIKRMDEMESLIKDTIVATSELPEVNFDCSLSMVHDPGELQIDMMYDLDNYKILRRKLGKDYRFRRRWFHRTLGSYFVEFKHRTLNIKLDIRMSLNETTSCKLIVDHYTQPEPVYKVECK